LDFLPVFLGFPSEKVWISFRADLDFLHRAGAGLSTHALEMSDAVRRVRRTRLCRISGSQKGAGLRPDLYIRV
jgi:hypothetical protein